MSSAVFTAEDGGHRVSPCRSLSGTVKVAGDKSISHRAAMLFGLAAGRTELRGFLASEDCLNTLGAVKAMGAHVEVDGTDVAIEGTGGRFSEPGQVLDMGNSGTGMRLMAGVLAGQPFVSEMTGDESLRSRPMRRIKDPLERMGAVVELLGPNGCAPVRIHGAALRPMRYEMPVASAQVKSCVLLAGLFAEGVTEVVEPAPTRDHTERLLRAAGVRCVTDGPVVSVTGGDLKISGGGVWSVPGDFSSAAFWLAAAAMRPGSDVSVEGVGINPRRTALLDVLRRMGAEVEVTPATGRGAEWEPVGTVRVRGRGLKGTEIGGGEIPNLIDELPMIAGVALAAVGRTVIRDAKELRVKESDRIATTAETLTRFGGRVTVTPDGMIIDGSAVLKGGCEVESRGDHRIAMMAAVLGLLSDSPVRIRSTGCIRTSYPSFWRDMDVLAGTGGNA